jgi:hypothetical protein
MALNSVALNISKLTAQKINFTTQELTIKENAYFVLTSTNGNINGKIIIQYGGGKSGDTVLRIQIGKIEYVLKIFQNKNNTSKNNKP